MLGSSALVVLLLVGWMSATYNKASGAEDKSTAQAERLARLEVQVSNLQTQLVELRLQNEKIYNVVIDIQRGR